MSIRQLLTAACLLVPLPLHANVMQATQPQPPTTAASVEQLVAAVTQVSGIVQVRNAEGQPWQAAKVGMKVPVGGECRTGPKSSITLTLPPDQSIILDRLGTVQILEAFRSGNKLKTDLGMRYGRVRYTVEAAGMEHDAAIHSPSSALTVRGSDVEMTDYALDSTIIVRKGLAERQKKANPIVTLGTSPEASYETAPVEIDDEDVTPANTQRKRSAGPVVRLALSSSENKLIQDQPIRMTAPVITPPPPKPPKVIVSNQPPTGMGMLSFVLDWTGDHSSGNITPDLDLFVITPRGEKLTPHNGSFQVPSGGAIGPNDRGGPGRAGGRESAAWQTSFPLGNYGYGVQYAGSGDPNMETGDPATFKITVTRNGQQINANFQDTVHPADPKVTLTINVPTQGPAPAAKQQAAGAKTVRKADVTTKNRKGRR
jgi:hypothetical protein